MATGWKAAPRLVEHLDGTLELLHWDDVLTAQAKAMTPLPLLGVPGRARHRCVRTTRMPPRR